MLWPGVVLGTGLLILVCGLTIPFFGLARRIKGLEGDAYREEAERFFDRGDTWVLGPLGGLVIGIPIAGAGAVWLLVEAVQAF